MSGVQFLNVPKSSNSRQAKKHVTAVWPVAPALPDCAGTGTMQGVQGGHRSSLVKRSQLAFPPGAVNAIRLLSRAENVEIEPAHQLHCRKAISERQFQKGMALQTQQGIKVSILGGPLPASRQSAGRSGGCSRYWGCV